MWNNICHATDLIWGFRVGLLLRFQPRLGRAYFGRTAEVGLGWWRALSLPLGRLVWVLHAYALVGMKHRAGQAQRRVWHQTRGSESDPFSPSLFPSPAVGKVCTYSAACCLTGQGFQKYDCPQSRNAKRIRWELPGACTKPLWHARRNTWACWLAVSWRQ